MPIFPLSKVKRALSPGRAPVTALELSSEESVGSAAALSAEQTGTLRDSDPPSHSGVVLHVYHQEAGCSEPRHAIVNVFSFSAYCIQVGKLDKRFLG